MATETLITDILPKNSKILVTVEEAMPDIILVTYNFESKLFQGVLLDSTKRNLPYGVHKLNPAFDPKPSNDDKLFAVSQRFNYSDKQLPPRPKAPKVKNSRMTVRLRPRQVLCSKCKGICNENSENVDRKRKSEPPPPQHELNTRSQTKKIEPTKNSDENEDPLNCSDSDESPTKKPKLWDEGPGMIGVVDGVRTLKISFGRGGEETVLKIPKIETARAKAAKRALKKAKKEARRKIVGAGSVCNLSGASPRYAIASPRYTIGSTSPRYTISPTEALIPRRHKHKVKHKKKHREHKEDPLFIPETDTAIKERCLKQKLSISLKRLTENSYRTKCTSPTDSSDGCDETPNFPPVSQILEMVSSTTVEDTGRRRGFDADGNVVEVGDIVWGKIHGFPWWPGKVLNILDCDSVNGIGGEEIPPKAQAHVAWYGSATSSIMPCEHLTPFLENFKSRHIKKRRGQYREAIRQATNDAQNETSRTTSSSSISTPLVSLVSPPLASPREIDCAS